jgi:hypothetical protein
VSHAARRDWSFFHWAVVGFMIAFGVVAILSIGFPFFVLGLVLLGVLLGRGPRWPAALGVPTGVGAVGLLLGALGSVTAPGAWAAAGAGLVAFGTLAFWWLRCRPRWRHDGIGQIIAPPIA